MRHTTLALGLAVVLAAAACAAATPRQLGGSPVEYVWTGDAAPEPAPEPAPDPSLDDHNKCFLNRFRAIDPAEAKAIGQRYRAKLNEVTVTSVVLEGVAMALGVVLMLFGYKLVEYVLILAGFSGGYVLTFWAVSAIMKLGKWDNCWVLGIVPVVGGILGNFLVQKAEKLIFFTLGALTALPVGHYVYVLALSHLEAHMKWNHELVFYGTLSFMMLLGGSAAIKLERKILAFATSLVGSFVFSVGFWSFLTEVLKVPAKWAAWIHPCMMDVNHPCIPKIGIPDTEGPDGSQSFIDWKDVDAISAASVEVLVPTILSLVLFIAGLAFQVRLQRKNKPDELTEGFATSPYGGFGGRGSTQMHM